MFCNHSLEQNHEYGLQRNTDSNKMVKGVENNGMGDGSVRAAGEVFVPKTFPLSSQEPTCEQLRAMWIFSKRQSRAAEITNEIPTYRDPFTYNVWEPLYSGSRTIGAIRMGSKERSRLPIFGRVVSREPILPQRIPFEQRQRHADYLSSNSNQSKLLSAQGRTTYGGLSSPRRASANRYMGLPNSSAANVEANPNSVAVQGSFQKLKELIWTERAKELTQQRRAEELAARAAVLKEIANGQEVQLVYKPPLGSQADSIVADKNRSPDSDGNLYVSDGRISIARGQAFENNNKLGYKNNGPQASTRHIGSSYKFHSSAPRLKEAFYTENTKAGKPDAFSRLKIPATEVIFGEERGESVIGIPRTYPLRQSHFRERNRSLFTQYNPSQYFQRNTRKFKNLQFKAQPDSSKNIPDFNDNYLSSLAPIENYITPNFKELNQIHKRDGMEKLEYDLFDYNSY